MAEARRRWEGPYGISALPVPPGDGAGEPRGQERRDGLGRLDREQERGIPIGILADAAVFVAGVDEELLAPVVSTWLFFTGTLSAGTERVGAGRTAISKRPSCAARWSEVLPLSAKSGFCRLVGLFLMMRWRRVRSLRWMARRMRMETSTLRVCQDRDDDDARSNGLTY